MNKKNKRSDYNEQIEITFALMEERDRLLEQYYRVAQKYKNALVMVKLMDESINMSSGGDVFEHIHKHIENEISNDFVVMMAF